MRMKINVNMPCLAALLAAALLIGGCASQQYMGVSLKPGGADPARARCPEKHYQGQVTLPHGGKPYWRAGMGLSATTRTGAIGACGADGRTAGACRIG